VTTKPRIAIENGKGVRKEKSNYIIGLLRSGVLFLGKRAIKS
jgi:hypothetical protein